MLNDRHGNVSTVIHETGYIVLRHLGQLLLKDAFQSSKDYSVHMGSVIVDHVHFDFTVTLLDNRWLCITPSVIVL